MQYGRLNNAPCTDCNKQTYSQKYPKQRPDCGCRTRTIPRAPRQAPCACAKPSCVSCKPCESNAKICHVTVQTAREVRRYRNSYVIVQQEGNALYHVDDRGNPLVVHRQNLFINNHTPEQGAFRSTMVFDMFAKRMFIYDPEGNVKQIRMEDI